MSRIIPFNIKFAHKMQHWDYSKNTLDPTTLPCGKPVKVWFICDKGHSSQKRAYKFDVDGCLYCSHLSCLREDSLAERCPDLMINWDFSKNTIDPYTIRPNSNKKVHWLCHLCQHEWITPPNSRAGRDKKHCPGCSIPAAKKTCLERYGTENPIQLPQIKERVAKTNLEKFGCENPFGNKEVQDKIKKTNMQKYGVPFSSQTSSMKAKSRTTCLERYGVEHASQNREIFARQQSSSRAMTTVKHWKTGEDLICCASYELKTVLFLNSNKIDFKWQIPFTVPVGEISDKSLVYFIDLYLPDSDKYIEIKGWFRRKLSLDKWLWFHEKYPNSELWDKAKLTELGII